MSLVDWIIRRARKYPYFHLHHRDGSLYMERFWLMPGFMLELVNEPDKDNTDGQPYYRPKKWVPISLKVHHICTIDYDRDMHDHPWWFFSRLLRGGYTEKRPLFDTPYWILRRDGSSEEPSTYYPRRPGKWVYRRARDRHVIVHVLPDTWTLLIQGRKSQDWGFYTPRGYIPWREYHGLKSA